MIRATAKRKDGRYLLLIGLSEGNVRRLRAGEPISFDLSNMGNPDVAHVAICWGESELEIMSELREAGFDFPELPVPGETKQ